MMFINHICRYRCVFVFYVPSVNTPFPLGIEPQAVAWQSITLLLRHARSRCKLITHTLTQNPSYLSSCERVINKTRKHPYGCRQLVCKQYTSIV